MRRQADWDTAGLELGSRGGIHVDDQMRTSDPNIWAVGDAVEIRSVITGVPELIPLAGPANRQGRIAAEVISGRDSRFRGMQGTAVCGFFGIVVAMTGATEKSLKRAGNTDFQAVYLHPGHHAAYYPGAKPIHMKLLFNRTDGRILGAQAVGEEGVERRVDVIAMAMQMGGTVFDLEEAELCYAPQYGAAKDPVNVCGMIAANVVRGDVALADWTGLSSTTALILDVRDPVEFEQGAINIPLGQLRGRAAELPRDREIWINCGVGQRAYYACRLLTQRGFQARNLSGGYESYRACYPQGVPRGLTTSARNCGAGHCPYTILCVTSFPQDKESEVLMSENDSSGLGRRSFLTTVGSGATLLGVAAAARAQSPQASSGSAEKWQPMRHKEDDWLELPGQHRFIFDTTTPDSMNESLLFAGNFYIANSNGYGLKDADLAVVLVARHRSTPFGYTNAIWEKYGVPISTRQNFVDPQTKEAPKVNVYSRQIDGLVRRGTHFAVCQMATRAYAGVIAAAVGTTPDAIYSELAANLVPNAHLVPAGIVAVNRAQERGYSFMAG